MQIVGALTREVSAEAGTSTLQSINLLNAGSEPVYVRVSFRDIGFNELGRPDDGSATSHDRSSRDWMTGPAEPVLVPGNSTVAVEFSVNPPADASGGYWSAIIVQPEQYAERTWTINDRTVMPIQIGTEYAGVVYTNIIGTGTNQLVFGEAGIESENGLNSVSVLISNEGDRVDVFELRADFMNPDGTLAKQAVVNARLLGGQVRRVSIPAASLPAGDYTLILVADAGQATLFGQQYQISIP